MLLKHAFDGRARDCIATYPAVVAWKTCGDAKQFLVLYCEIQAELFEDVEHACLLQRFVQRANCHHGVCLAFQVTIVEFRFHTLPPVIMSAHMPFTLTQ